MRRLYIITLLVFGSLVFLLNLSTKPAYACGPQEYTCNCQTPPDYPPNCCCKECVLDCGCCTPYPPGGECTGNDIYNSCGSDKCNCGSPPCNDSDPDTPSLSSPASGTNYTYNPSVPLDWNGVGNFGENCDGNNNRYHICISTTNGGACDLLDTYVASNVTNYSFVPAQERTHYWRVAASNGAREKWTGWWSFSVKVIPNCTSLSGPTEPRVGVGSTYTANFTSPMDALTGSIFRTDLSGGNNIITTNIGNTPGSTTGTWTPTLAEVGNKTVYCRAWNDGRCECRPPAFVDSWPRANCLGPNYSLAVCVEGFNSASTTYVSKWGSGGIYDDRWSACDNATHTRTRSRTCTQNCVGGSYFDDCNDFFSNAANCPVAGECTFVGNTQTQTQDCEGVITGRLYDSSDCAPGQCSCALSTPLGTGSALIVTPNYAWGLQNPLVPITVSNTGVYTFDTFLGAINNTFALDFSNLLAANQIGDTNPKSVCPSAIPTYLGCDPFNNTQPCRPQLPLDVQYFDFGFYRKYGGWWQVVGGKVHADVDIQTKIPASVEPLPYVAATSNQKLILDDTNARNGLLTYGNSFNMGSNPNALVSNSNDKFKQTYDGIRYNYDYFSAKFNANTSTPWASGNTPPAYVANGNGVMLLRYTGSLPLTINTFNVAAGEKYVILVPGSVNVSGDITVASGGFLSIISSGSITFQQTVNKVEGWYLADNTITVDSNGDETTELQFVGNGSFIAWGGFSLNRNRGFTNNKFPAELFTFRQDLVTSSPELMKFPYKYYSQYNP